MDFLRWARIHWDRVVAVAAAVAGAVALFVGWNGASRTAYPAEQLPYLLSGGLVGLFLFGVGATLWLSADLRDEWGELRGIRDELRAARREVLETPPLSAPAPPAPHAVAADPVLPAAEAPPAALGGRVPADAPTADAALPEPRPGSAPPPQDDPSDNPGSPAGNGASGSSVTGLARSKRA